ncbi:MAG: LTA synthase family protein [Oscillospiraceae bacterium]|nr:LTA synthase family protein [Oscillospiraceae bacterium]
MLKTSETTAKNQTSAVKELLPAWSVAFAFCFMLFLYEPLVMYATNKDDLRFDLGTIFAPLLGIFLIFFASLAAVLSGLFFLFRALRKPAVFKIITAIVFVIFAATYVQGNFLAGNLPALDGAAIDWSSYTKDNIITLAVWVVLLALMILALVKCELDSVMKFAALLSAAIFVMLSVSLVSVLARNDALHGKGAFISTAAGLNGASTDKNFFIFMVDSQSAAEFSEVISDEEFNNAFNDFTFYPDTLSTFAYTRDSLPYIISGHMNLNEQDFGDYTKNALNSSLLFEELDERGYELYLYSNELSWYGSRGFDIKNAVDFKKGSLRFGEFFKQEARYVSFKYLPYIFKKYSDIEALDLNRAIKMSETDEMYDWRNDALYDGFNNSAIETSGAAQFRLIHAEGAHVPLDMDENLNRIENGTYIQKTAATAKLIRAFIESLKQAGVYDNSAIIILSDHGYQPASGAPENYILSRFNPLLMIKGFGERHDFAVSDKPVSYLDLPDAYVDLLNGKQTAELFPDAEYPRTRTVIWYEIYKEEHKEEYRTDGKATEWDKFVNTGKIYDL